MTTLRTLELLSTDTSEDDGFPRQYYGIRGEPARVIVKRMGGAVTDPLPDRLEEWLDALGLVHGCCVSVIGDGALGAVHWSVRLDGEPVGFQAPFDDEAIRRAALLRRCHPPRGYAAVRGRTDLVVGQKVSVRPTGRVQRLAGLELHFTVASVPDWDGQVGAFRVALVDDRGNAGLWLLRDDAMPW